MINWLKKIFGKKELLTDYEKWKIKNEVISTRFLYETNPIGTYFCRGILFYGIKTEQEVHEIFKQSINLNK